MKITNASSKTVFLLNGKVIAPKKNIEINVEKGSDLYQQIISLEKNGILTLD